VILSGQSIRARHYKRPLIQPFYERGLAHGMSYGLGPHGYDIRLDQPVEIAPRSYALGVALEWLDMPNDLAGRIMDKSSWIRQGLTVGNSIVEAGWRGFLTIELFNWTGRPIVIKAGAPIAQLVFELLDQSAEKPYRGKYFDQPRVPVAAIAEYEPVRPAQQKPQAKQERKPWKAPQQRR